MTNPGSPQEPPKQTFKTTIAQGIIGAAALAGTTAIPIMVQKVLNPTPSDPAPAAVVSPQPSRSTAVDPSQIQSATVAPAKDDSKPSRKHKRNDDDDDDDD